MHIVLVGVSHKSAPIELRERLAFRREQLPEAFVRLRAEVGLKEAAILSTCNRVEIYAGVPEVDGTIARLHRFLSEHGGLEATGLVQRLYHHTEPQSVRHLFAVASGLDSMVLGEGEILHQVKHAYEWAKDCGATGKLFNALFQRALNTAKAVRMQTGIGHGCLSIGTVAVVLSEKIFGNLSEATVLLIGMGKIGELTLKRLTDRGVRHVRVMNRSPERAVDLASAYHATPLPLAALSDHLLEADIVITSTSAPNYLLSRAGIELAMRKRRQRPLCLIDLGVPRNVEPSAGCLDNVYRFDVDDLQGVVEQGQQERRHAVEESRLIIDQKVERFLSWWHSECPVSSVECRVEASGEQVVGLHSSLVTRHSSLR